MSAFELSETHINAMLTGGIRLSYGVVSAPRWFLDPQSYEPNGDPTYTGVQSDYTEKVWGSDLLRAELNQGNATDVGRILLNANRRSVAYRYREDWTPAKDYEFHPLPGSPRPEDVIMACDSYDYQSCELPDWEGSEAQKISAAIRKTAVTALLERSDADGWSIDDRQHWTTVRSPA